MTEVDRISMAALRLLACLLLVGWISVDASGQIGGTGTQSESDPLDILRDRMSRSASAAGVPQEGPVDPDIYQVGPGDVFNVGIGGMQAISLNMTVSADGHLVLPDAGTVYVSGLTLRRATEAAMVALKAAYRNVAVTVTLAQPRQFYVHVVGAVTSPGRFLVMPVGRVLDAVALAFADTTRPSTSNPRFRSSFRSVVVTGTNGDIRKADLIRYLLTGDTSENPYLRDGDVVQVNAYDPALGAVFINGELPFAGKYEYRPGDTVADLLEIAAGGGSAADRYRLVRITRRGPDGSLSTVPTAADLGVENLRSVDVQPLDQIYIRRDIDRDRGVVLADGAVQFPGSYPMEKGRTTLLDLIDAAGGFRDDGLLRGAYLERRAALSLAEVPMRFVGFSISPNLPSIYLPDTSAVVQKIRLAPFGWRGTNYLLRELRTDRRVALDLSKASREDMARIPLVDGDRLVVPKDDGVIFVFGQVARAGFVPFVPERRVSYYVGEAGGKEELAADVYLVQAGSGSYKKGDNSVVEPGDMIFVDSREYLADSAELSRLAVEEKRIEADQKFRTTQIILQTIGSIASIIALIISASR